MTKLLLAVFALCAIHVVAAVTHEEVLETQRLLEKKMYITKHLDTYTRRVFNGRLDDFKPMALRVWNALNREVLANLEKEDCVAGANATLAKLQVEIENSVATCKSDLLNDFQNLYLVVLEAYFNIMRGAEKSCDQVGVDYHKCVQQLIDSSIKYSDETMEVVKTLPGEITSLVNLCLINLYSRIVDQSASARKDMYDCIGKQ